MNEITKQLLSELNSLVNGIEELQNRARYLLGIVQGVAFAEEVRSKENNQYQNKNCLVIEEKGGIMKYDGKKITKTADGKLWWARYTVNYKTYAVYAATQLECYSKLKTAVLNVKKGKLPIEKKNIKYYEWVKKWLEIFDKPNLKESSYRYKKSKIKNYIANSIIADKFISDVTSVDIQELLVGIPYTMARQGVYFILNASMRSALENGLISKNPCEFIKKPKHISQNRMALTRVEQQEFLKAIETSKYKMLYELMLFQGLRSGEARAFRHCDIHDNSITVAVSIDDYGKECSTKTGKVREIPIFEIMKEELARLKSNSNVRLFKKSTKHTGQKEFNQIMESLGMNYDLYVLRHTFGTRCAESGIAVKQIAEWMGHSDSSTTLKYYTHINKEFEAENVQKVGDFLEKNIQNSIQKD